ncbi:MAG: glycoside hydrolase family 99-like domain-containing protein [PVC group bacterium]
MGAYYYLWFPYNFQKKGYLRGLLKPPQSPVLGLYDSRDPGVCEQHIAWCSRYGIDFLVVDWWPSRPHQNNVLNEGLLRARNIEDIRWCIFYETQSLGVDRSSGTIIWTDEKIDRFVSDLLVFSTTYFRHPGYLQVEGRPVIFLYLTRNFAGNTRAAISRARQALRARGVDPFIIADEVFWRVTADGEGDDSPPGWAETPQRGRIELFDGITAYNVYETRKSEHQGYAASSRYLPEVGKMFDTYRDACGDDVVFIPNVIPGYNDRPLRIDRDHYIIPRLWEADTGAGSLFSVLFDRLGLPYVDPEVPLIMITSWNEWNEDTAIEPLAPAPPTARDISESGAFYTGGYPYAGFGETYLRIIRDRVVAVSGRVVDGKGNPVGGITVEGRSAGKLLASDKTDAAGYYRLSRLLMGEGAYQVGLKGHGIRKEVEVQKTGTTCGVDFHL